MQTPFSLTNPVLNNFENVISPARLARFSGTVGGDKHKAFRLYIWNSRLCEEFYLPLQFAEISIRNNIHYTLTRRYTANWYCNPAIIDQLTDKYRKEIAGKILQQKQASGPNFTVDHVVSGMTFGFWVHLLTARYDNILWQQGMKRSFPNVPTNFTRANAHAKADQLRLFRNKVAHHYAIYDRKPAAEYQNIQDIISWSCTDTLWIMRQVSNPSKIINARPKI